MLVINQIWMQRRLGLLAMDVKLRKLQMCSTTRLTHNLNALAMSLEWGHRIRRCTVNICLHKLRTHSEYENVMFRK
eukprot:1700129-Amphidinium_carterae.1